MNVYTLAVLSICRLHSTDFSERPNEKTVSTPYVLPLWSCGLIHFHNLHVFKPFQNPVGDSTTHIFCHTQSEPHLFASVLGNKIFWDPVYFVSIPLQTRFCIHIPVQWLNFFFHTRMKTLLDLEVFAKIFEASYKSIYHSSSNLQ